MRRRPEACPVGHTLYSRERPQGGYLDVTSFAEIEFEFNRRVERIVWCTFATSDSKGRLRSRMLHPIWDGSTGWIATGRHSFKAKHLESNPYVSLTY